MESKCERNTRFVLGWFVILFGFGIVICGILLAIWYSQNGYIAKSEHYAGCETCEILVVQFTTKSNNEYYTGTFKEKAKLPAENNITLQDLYDLHPIGSPIGMIVNPLFIDNSLRGTYPEYMLGVSFITVIFGFIFVGSGCIIRTYIRDDRYIQPLISYNNFDL